MIAYRLGKTQFINDLTGTGAYLYGGRWNNKGIRMLYTGQSRALAMAEASVHLPLHLVPTGYSILELEFPDEMIQVFDQKQLEHVNWRSFPASYVTQEIGDTFIESSLQLALKVPSVIVEGDFNYLLNPNFPEYTNLVKINDIRDFPFDERIFNR
ncbi:RES family NAD+ phosphorylase [Flagellimonas hymeniacidonis]|uniref:RES family NAD+ phosphorylase n=1 Tax=Flagellimonas hymeniacidonis TaxID=2603628 RepID=A0A5C8VAA8_9FLAO|nr:RES family NAD+ phosphorylase [Flagellimonas hymeniacidonis]TXN37728.1 RES family NAD+ phosphorylase [Flagellimonas hymeniacidonis]